MQGHAEDLAVRHSKGNEGGSVMPQEVINAIVSIIATGKEAIVRREKGKWVVLENGRRLVYKEK